MKLSLPRFDTARVLVAGDVMLDRYWHGATSRISPEAPVPVVRVEQTEERPGGAANVAANVVALGAAVTLTGLAGDDDAGRSLANRLQRLGVDVALETVAGTATITKLRVMSRHQQLLRVDFEDGFATVDPTRVAARVADNLPRADALVLSDYGKGALGAIEGLIDQARQRRCPVLVDPKGRDFRRYAGATVITPNMGELEAVVGPCTDVGALVDKGDRLRADLGLEALLVTRSEQGMTLIARNAPPLHLPARAREVFDVTGAGDTVIAVLAAALATGQALPDATALANLAAGMVVGKLGTASVTASELGRALYPHDEPARGVVDEDTLVRAVADAKAHGETIVMTNGCFDILHAGHVGYLEQARHLGSRLIVAVNTDESVRRLKGRDRPVNAVERRMRVLAALSCVDWVVAFNEDTPERLIGRVLPDYLVKGGDNDPRRIPGNETVWANGGQVVVMDYLDGCSTTSTIARLQGRS